MRARKVGSTQAGIVRTLERAGCRVWQVNGAIDLLACRAGKLYLIECETGKAPLTDTQREFIDQGWPLAIVRTEEEALLAVGLRL